jgi:hypothetical protein
MRPELHRGSGWGFTGCMEGLDCGMGLLVSVLEEDDELGRIWVELS